MCYLQFVPDSMPISSPDVQADPRTAPNIPSIRKGDMSVSDAYQLAGELQAQLRAERNSQAGNREEEQSRAAASLRLAIGLMDQTCHYPEYRKHLGVAGAIPTVVKLLRHASDKDQIKAWVICLRNLMADTAENGGIAIRAGAVTPVLDLCFSDVEEIQDHAAAVLIGIGCKVGKTESAAWWDCSQLAKLGTMGAILHLLPSRSKRLAAKGALLATQLSVEENPRKDLVTVGVIPLLVALLKDNTSPASRHAAACLANLASVKENWVELEDAGAVRQLVPLLRSKCSITQYVATFGFENLAMHWASHEHIIQAGGVKALLHCLQNGLLDAQTNAAEAFLSLSLNPAIAPALAQASVPLAEISASSQDKVLRSRASEAAHNIESRRATYIAIPERQPWVKGWLRTSILRLDLSPISDRLKKGCVAALVWMRNQRDLYSRLFRTNRCKIPEKSEESRERLLGDIFARSAKPCL